MLKKVFLNTCLTIILSSLTIAEAQAASFNSPTSVSPAQIVIQNALINTASGNQHAPMRLIAKDHKGLHNGQIYQVHFGETNSIPQQDGIYDVADETIYIQELLQADELSHQTTLRLINKKPLEFAIIETMTSVVKPVNERFFDATLIHKVNYRPADNY